MNTENIVANKRLIRYQTSEKGVLTLLLLFITLLWNLGSPFGGVADENTYLQNAIVASQDFFKQDKVLPERTILNITQSTCFAFNREISAKCQNRNTSDSLTSSIPAPEQTLHYPKIWFVLTAWPTLLLPGIPGIYSARVVASLLNMVPIVIGIFAWKRSKQLLSISIALSLTSLAITFMSGYNPNALEISSALGMSLLLFGRKKINWTANFALAWAAILLLASIPKPWSGVWALGTTVGFLILNSIREFVIISKNVKYLMLGSSFISFIFSITISQAAMQTNKGTYDPVDLSPLQVLGKFLLNSHDYFLEYAGIFGWRDIGPAPWVAFLWLAMISSFITISYLSADRQGKRIIWVLWLNVVLFVPGLMFVFLIEFVSIDLQTRYVMPFFIFSIFATLIFLKLRTSFFKFIIVLSFIVILLNFVWVFIRFSAGIPNDLYHANVILENIRSGNIWTPYYWQCCVLLFVSLIYLSRKYYRMVTSQNGNEAVIEY